MWRSLHDRAVSEDDITKAWKPSVWVGGSERTEPEHSILIGLAHSPGGAGIQLRLCGIELAVSLCGLELNKCKPELR